MTVFTVHLSQYSSRHTPDWTVPLLCSSSCEVMYWQYLSASLDIICTGNEDKIITYNWQTRSREYHQELECCNRNVNTPTLLTKIITHFISLIIKLIKTAHSDNQIIGGCKVEFELLVIVYAEDPSWVQVVRRKWCYPILVRWPHTHPHPPPGRGCRWGISPHLGELSLIICWGEISPCYDTVDPVAPYSILMSNYQ